MADGHPFREEKWDAHRPKSVLMEHRPFTHESQRDVTGRRTSPCPSPIRAMADAASFCATLETFPPLSRKFQPSALLSRLNRHPEQEGGLIFAGLDLEAAAMASSNFEGDEQTKAKPLLPRRACGAEEGLEQVILYVLGDRLALIRNRYHDFVHARCGDDFHRPVRRAMRQRVTEEVGY